MAGGSIGFDQNKSSQATFNGRVRNFIQRNNVSAYVGALTPDIIRRNVNNNRTMANQFLQLRKISPRRMKTTVFGGVNELKQNIKNSLSGGSFIKSAVLGQNMNIPGQSNDMAGVDATNYQTQALTDITVGAISGLAESNSRNLRGMMNISNEQLAASTAQFSSTREFQGLVLDGIQRIANAVSSSGYGSGAKKADKKEQVKEMEFQYRTIKQIREKNKRRRLFDNKNNVVNMDLLRDILVPKAVQMQMTMMSTAMSMAAMDPVGTGMKYLLDRFITGETGVIGKTNKKMTRKLQHFMGRMVGGSEADIASKLKGIQNKKMLKGGFNLGYNILSSKMLGGMTGLKREDRDENYDKWFQGIAKRLFGLSIGKMFGRQGKTKMSRKLSGKKVDFDDVAHQSVVSAIPDMLSRILLAVQSLPGFSTESYNNRFNKRLTMDYKDGSLKGAKTVAERGKRGITKDVGTDWKLSEQEDSAMGYKTSSKRMVDTFVKKYGSIPDQDLPNFIEDVNLLSGSIVTNFRRWMLTQYPKENTAKTKDGISAAAAFSYYIQKGKSKYRTYIQAEAAVFEDVRDLMKSSFFHDIINVKAYGKMAVEGDIEAFTIMNENSGAFQGSSMEDEVLMNRVDDLMSLENKDSVASLYNRLNSTEKGRGVLSNMGMLDVDITKDDNKKSFGNKLKAMNIADLELNKSQLDYFVDLRMKDDLNPGSFNKNASDFYEYTMNNGISGEFGSNPGVAGTVHSIDEDGNVVMRGSGEDFEGMSNKNIKGLNITNNYGNKSKAKKVRQQDTSFGPIKGNKILNSIRNVLGRIAAFSKEISANTLSLTKKITSGTFGSMNQGRGSRAYGKNLLGSYSDLGVTALTAVGSTANAIVRGISGFFKLSWSAVKFGKNSIGAGLKRIFGNVNLMKIGKGVGKVTYRVGKSMAGIAGGVATTQALIAAGMDPMAAAIAGVGVGSLIGATRLTGKVVKGSVKLLGGIGLGAIGAGMSGAKRIKNKWAISKTKERWDKLKDSGRKALQRGESVSDMLGWIGDTVKGGFTWVGGLFKGMGAKIVKAVSSLGKLIGKGLKWILDTTIKNAGSGLAGGALGGMLAGGPAGALIGAALGVGIGAVSKYVRKVRGESNMKLSLYDIKALRAGAVGYALPVFVMNDIKNQLSEKEEQKVAKKERKEKAKELKEKKKADKKAGNIWEPLEDETAAEWLARVKKMKKKKKRREKIGKGIKRGGAMAAGAGMGALAGMALASKLGLPPQLGMALGGLLGGGAGSGKLGMVTKLMNPAVLGTAALAGTLYSGYKGIKNARDDKYVRERYGLADGEKISGKQRWGTGVGSALSTLSLGLVKQNTIEKAFTEKGYMKSLMTGKGSGKRYAKAAAGAVIGGAIGSVVPILGTGIGMAIGGLVGGAIGFFSGKKEDKKALADFESGLKNEYNNKKADPYDIYGSRKYGSGWQTDTYGSNSQRMNAIGAQTWRGNTAQFDRMIQSLGAIQMSNEEIANLTKDNNDMFSDQKQQINVVSDNSINDNSTTIPGMGNNSSVGDLFTDDAAASLARFNLV